MKNKTLRIGAGIVGVTLAVGLVACSEEDTAAQGGRTIDNCGMEISIEEKPERIVTCARPPPKTSLRWARRIRWLAPARCVTKSAEVAEGL